MLLLILIAVTAAVDANSLLLMLLATAWPGCLELGVEFVKL